MTRGNANTRMVSDNEDHIRITHDQDVGDVLTENAELKKQHGGKIDMGGLDMRLAARVPMVLLEKWRIEEGLDYHLVGQCPEMTGRFWKKMQDPSWRNLRVWEGNVV